MTPEELRTARSELGYSQAQLGATLQPPVHRDTVGGWETGSIPLSVPRAMWLDSELRRLRRGRRRASARAAGEEQ
jgi:DNA-binding XRE family transcriptional regulator